MRYEETTAKYDPRDQKPCNTAIADPGIQDNADSAIKSLALVFEALGLMESRLFGTGLKSNDPKVCEVGPGPIDSQVRRLSQDSANLLGYVNTLYSRL